MRNLNGLLASCIALLLLTSTSHAQSVLLPGSLTGIGSNGPTGAKRLCAPLTVGLHRWQTGWITRLLKLDGEQAVLLQELAVDSARAQQAISSACVGRKAESTTDQLAAMERRLHGLVQAVTLIRPAYEQFYVSLNDKQKALLEAIGPGRRGWRW